MITPSAVDTMARTAWAEARSEGAEGMAGVLNVIMNRAAFSEVHPGQDWWGEHFEEICRAPKQFTCWNKGDPNLSKLLLVDQHDEQFVQALVLAQEAADWILFDNTNGATHYKRTDWAWPHSWGKERPSCAVIGRHSFYRLEDVRL